MGRRGFHHTTHEFPYESVVLHGTPYNSSGSKRMGLRLLGLVPISVRIPESELPSVPGHSACSCSKAGRYVVNPSMMPQMVIPIACHTGQESKQVGCTTLSPSLSPTLVPPQDDRRAPLPLEGALMAVRPHFFGNAHVNRNCNGGYSETPRRQGGLHSEVHLRCSMLDGLHRQ